MPDSEPHRHDDVGVFGVLGALQHAGSHLVGERQLDDIPLGQYPENVDQIPRVEPDAERLTPVGHLDVLARLTLVRIARRQLESTLLEMELDAPRALAG